MKRLTTLLALLMTIGACTEDHPVNPTPAGPAAPSVFVLSGTLYGHTATGVTPLPDVLLAIGSDIPFFRTNTDGQYRVELPGWQGRHYEVVAAATGYKQPCRALITLQDDHNVLDVHVVAESTLTSSGIPASFPLQEPTISGRITEQTPQGDRPVRGASVSGEFGWELNDDPAVRIRTLSDSAGRYLMCVAAGATGVTVTASGYTRARTEVNLAKSSSYDIVLVRQ